MDHAGTSGRGAFSPLAYSLFRWVWIASVASNVGTWMQNVGAAWLMTGLNASPLYVALVQTATSVPVFLLGVPAGAFADIVDRRKLLLITQGGMLAAAATLGGLTIAGLTGPWTLLSLTFALGIGATMNGPAWQAIVPELVPRSELPAAIGLNSLGFNLARAAGPALGGLVVGLMGVGPAFVLNAVSFVGVMVVLYLWKRKPELTSSARETVGSAMLAGIRYLRFAPPMHAVLIRSGVFIISASALWAILPLVAKVELKSESTGYGLLLGCLGLGSIIAALLLSRLRHLISMDLLVTSASVLFGIVNIALAWLTQFWVVGLALLAGGMGWMAINSSLNTAAQTSLPAWVRARALGAYILVFQGAMAIGSVIWGAVASRFGLRSTLLAAGIAIICGALLTARFRLAGHRELDTTPSPHWPEPQLMRDTDPERGPVLVTVEYFIDPAHASEFIAAMREMRRIRRRDGAVRWGIFEDAATPGRYLESFLVQSWGEHLRQHERVTVSDRKLEEQALKFHRAEGVPKVVHWLAAQDD
ncbi:MAG: MFS transporter [Acidobacteriota bacterium]|nr:MFS transporter [Acidobacteriota bacterium]